LKTGPGDQTPKKVQLVRPYLFSGLGSIIINLNQFANQENLDFDDIEDKTPTQEFEIAQGREVGEYAVKSVVGICVSSQLQTF
jgi:hypothetical protein